MRQTAVILSILFIAAAAFAHAGHAHTYMATITMLHDDGSLMIKTSDGKDMTIATSAATTYAHADGTAAKRADLAAGMRVVIKMMTDGKTAASVKMGK